MLGTDEAFIIRLPSKPVETAYDRRRTDVITLFDVYLEVDGRAEKPKIVYSYPADYQNDDVFSSVCKFTFPCGPLPKSFDNDEDAAVQQFAFVVTERSANFTYGFCRMAPRSGICACLVTAYDYPGLFYKFLNHLAMARGSGNVENLEKVLANAYHLGVPESGQKFELTQISTTLQFFAQIPTKEGLPTLTDDKSMLEFCNAVEDDQMIALYTSLLHERPVVITGRKLGQVTACCFALSRILYPFHWQYTFAPIISADMLDMPANPMPYIMGIPKQSFESAHKSGWSQFCLFDIDTKIFDAPYRDKLPTEVQSYLKHNLKLNSQTFLSDGFARTFLRANVLLFGRWKAGFTTDSETSENIYDMSKFVAESRSSFQSFLRQILLENGSYFFMGFVTERLKSLSDGKEIYTEFDIECINMERKTNISSALRDVATLPEIQNTVSNVLDGASNVVGSLKGKMQAISIKDRFGRLAPKKSRSKTRKLKNPLDPMFVDASQYGFGRQQSIPNEKNGQRSASESPEHATEAFEADLIDFSDPPSTSADNNGEIPLAASAPSTAESNFDEFLRSFNANPSSLVNSANTSPFGNSIASDDSPKLSTPPIRKPVPKPRLTATSRPRGSPSTNPYLFNSPPNPPAAALLGSATVGSSPQLGKLNNVSPPNSQLNATPMHRRLLPETKSAANIEHWEKFE